MATPTTSQPPIAARSGLGLRAHRAGKDEEETRRDSTRRPETHSVRLIRNLADLIKANCTDMAVDLNLYDACWHELFKILVKELDGLRIEPGEEVERDGRIIGGYFAHLSDDDRAICLVSCDEPEAESILEALNQRGRQALLIDADRQAGMVRVLVRVFTGEF